MVPWTIRVPELAERGPSFAVRVGSGQLMPRRSSEHPAAPESDAVAMLDTGAAITVIQTALARALDLPLLGSVELSTPTDVSVSCPTYSVRLMFPDGSTACVLAAAIARPELPVDLLLGRDVLANAVFVYQGHDESFTLAL